MPPNRPKSIDGFALRPAAPPRPAPPKAQPALHLQPKPQIRPKPKPRPPVAMARPASETVPMPESQPAPRPMQHRPFASSPTQQPAKRRRLHLWQHMQLPLFVIGGMVAGMFMQAMVIGLALLGIYALVAWFARVSSRVTFVLAFLSLMTVVVLLLVRQNVELAGNFATYTFVLLVTGIVSLVLESRGRPKLRRDKQRSKI